MSITRAAMALFMIQVASPDCLSDELSEVVASWKARSESTRFATLRWKEVIEHQGAEDEKPLKATGDFAFHRLDGGGMRWRVRLTNAGFVEPGEMRVQESTLTDMGVGTFTLLFPKGDRGIPVAETGLTRADHYLNDARLYPIYLSFLPHDEGFKFPPLDLFDVVAVQESVDGVPCTLLNSGDVNLWVASDRGHRPVRLTKKDRFGILTYSYDFSYARTDAGQQRLKGWEYRRYMANGKNVLERRRTTVTFLDMQDAPPRDLFFQKLPIGTWLNDLIEKESYIIRRDGSRRKIGPHESLDNYHELLQSDNAETQDSESHLPDRSNLHSPGR